MKITFIQTGGTIDKDYPKTTKGYAFEFGEPATRRILEKLNPSFEYEILTACQKDSLEITDDDRQELVNLINANSADKFIITHGTDTIIETANFIFSKIKHKVIILTGAQSSLSPHSQPDQPAVTASPASQLDAYVARNCASVQ